MVRHFFTILVGGFLNPGWLESASSYKAASYTLLDNFIESFLKEVALLPFARPCFAERGVIRDGVIQLESTEPAIGNIKLNFLYQPPLLFDAIQISDQEHFEHTDRVDRWAASRWIS